MKSNENNSARVGEFFDNNWGLYLQTVHNNALYHVEMFAALNDFLNQNFKEKQFTLADLGSGDSSAIFPVLKNKSIKRYIGVDSAPHLIENAKTLLAELPCEKELICEDMAAAIKKLNGPIDIIFNSYALHHLSHDNKIKFIQDCQNKLEKKGYFIMIDGVLAPNQNRDEWLNKLEKRLRETNADATKEEMDHLMDHPRKDDFPESLATFSSIAKMQNWKKFEVIIDKGNYAFMIFTKD